MRFPFDQPRQRRNLGPQSIGLALGGRADGARLGLTRLHLCAGFLGGDQRLFCGNSLFGSLFLRNRRGLLPLDRFGKRLLRGLDASARSSLNAALG